MFLKFWRFLAVVLLVLGLGPAICHLYEMPAKLTFDGTLWLTLLQKLYPRTFGPIGGLFEVAAMVAVIVLAILVRKRGATCWWSTASALCLVISHAVFWIWVYPVNTTLVPLTPETLPAGWTALRNQWEYAHATRAVLQLIGLAAILVSILIETPKAELKQP